MLYQHTMNLVQNPSDIGEFLAETLGYNLPPSEIYNEGLKNLVIQVFRLLPSIPNEDEVEEVEYRINMVESSLLGLAIAEDKSPSAHYPLITHCTAVLAVTQAMENVECWIEWAAEEYGVDLNARLH